MISYIIRFQLNIYALLLLLLLFSIIKLKRDIYRFSTLMLNCIIWLTITALVIEPLSFIFDGLDYPLAIAINYISNYGLVLISPILIGMWASYLDYKILGDRRRLARRIYYQQGSIFILVICIINMFVPIVFSIEDNHHFHSEPYQWISLFVVYSYYIYIIVLAILNRKRISNTVLFGIIAFFILPVVGSMMQMINSNLFFAWTMLAMATIVVYIFLETSTGIRDFLTKLYSRRTLENYIKNLMESKRHFGGVMFDLDSFKPINDRYGHQIGDQVLIRFAELLVKTFKEEKMVARLGGDEFFLIFEKLDKAKVLQRLSELHDSVANDSLFQQYNLPGFSCGLSLIDESKTLDDFFVAADREMYRNKQSDNH